MHIAACYKIDTTNRSRNSIHKMSGLSQPYKEKSPEESTAENVIYEIWFSVAEEIFKRVCEVTELNEEQIAALKAVALRPNDFQVEIA